MESRDIVAAICRNAEISGSSVALMNKHATVTYEQLLSRMCGVQAALHIAGVKRGDRVGILAQNSLAYVTAMCGILHAGCTFVSLPVRDPESRLEKISRAADLTVVLSDGTRNFSGHSVLSINDVTANGTGDSGSSRDVPEAVDQTAYIIFTSGSTGEPKGVCIPRASFSHAVYEAGRQMRFSPQTRSLAILPLQYDGSFSSVFPVLTFGGTVYINEAPICLPKVFCETFRQHELTHTTFTPTYLGVLLDAADWAPESCVTWKTLAIGGEDLNKPTLRRLKTQCPWITVYNRYGPTETTMAVSTHEVTDAVLASDGKIPLGRPHAGVDFVALNSAGRPVAPGVPGELYIGGAQLMAGYLNDEVATQAVLSSSVVSGQRLYKTGDIVTLDADGLYTYLGRADNVIKRDGNRISLDEIERALGSVQGVAECACIALHSANGTKIVAAVRVLTPELNEKAIRRELMDRIPASMNPDFIEIVASLPSTARGKIDRAALRDQYSERLQAIAPRASQAGAETTS